LVLGSWGFGVGVRLGGREGRFREAPRGVSSTRALPAEMRRMRRLWYSVGRCVRISCFRVAVLAWGVSAREMVRRRSGREAEKRTVRGRWRESLVGVGGGGFRDMRGDCVRSCCLVMTALDHTGTSRPGREDYLHHICFKSECQVRKMSSVVQSGSLVLDLEAASRLPIGQPPSSQQPPVNIPR
jgi:hypothetical protein